MYIIMKYYDKGGRNLPSTRVKILPGAGPGQEVAVFW